MLTYPRVPVRHGSLRGLAACALLLLAFAGEAAPQSAELLWEDRFGGTTLFDRGEGVAVRGRRAVVVGTGSLGAPGEGDINDDFLVRAYDVRTGEVLWDDQHDEAGLDDRGRGVAVQGRRAFAVGHVRVPGDAEGGPPHDDAVVRAYDARTGELLWEDSVDRGGNDSFEAVVVKGRRVVVAGTAQDLAEGGGDRDWIVRAYDARDGELLWEEILDNLGFEDFLGLVPLAIQGRRVVVGGTIGDAAFPLPEGVVQNDWLVRAHDVRDGDLLWEDQHDGALGFSDSLAAVAIRGSRVFAAGTVTDDTPRGGPQSDALLRALRARDGSLLWSQQVDQQGIGDFDEFRLVAARGSRVVAAGTFTGPSVSSDGMLLAFRARTGAPLWEQTWHLGSEDVGGLAVGRGAVVVGGSAFLEAEGSQGDWLVRSHDLRDGDLRWSDHFDQDGQNDRVEEGTTVAIAGRRVIVVGDSREGNESSAAVRTYDVR